MRASVIVAGAFCTRGNDIAFMIFARRVSEQSFGQAFSKACGVRGKALQHINKALTFGS